MCDVPNLYNLPEQSWMGAWPPRNPPDACHLDMFHDNDTASKALLSSFNYSTTVYADEAVRRLKLKKDGERTFIYLAFQAVHGPWTLPDVGSVDQLLLPTDPGYADRLAPYVAAPLRWSH